MSDSAQIPRSGGDGGHRNPRRRSALDRLAAVPARQVVGRAAAGGDGPDPGDADSRVPDYRAPDHGEPDHVPPEYVPPEYVPPEYVAPEHDSTEEDVDGDAGPGPGGDGDGWPVVATPAWLTPAGGSPRSSSPLSSSPGPTGFGIGDLDDPDGRDDDDEPDGDPPARRFAVAPPAAIAIILIGIIACAAAGFGLLRTSEAAPAVDFPAPGASSPPAPAPASPGASASSEVVAPPTPTATLVVSVVGLVHRPGLVTLRSSARVADAIAAAGGARAGADTVSLNLAQVLRDGDQVLVGYAGPEGRMTMRSAVVSGAGTASSATDSGTASSGAPGSGAGGSGATASGGGLVNLNTASETELDALPGVGPVTAKAIIEWRSRSGGFSSVDQLGEVDGIGPARLAKLRDLVTV